MNKKVKKWMRRYLNLYNLSIVGAILIIIISLCVIFRTNIQAGFTAIGSKIHEITYRPEEKTLNGVKVVASKKSEDEEISEEEAREMAVKQFERLGESVDKESLKVSRLKRKDNLYYFISSKENTMEISIKGGVITRINAEVVPE